MTDGSSDGSAPRRPYRPSRAMRLLLALGERIAIGSIDVELPDGTRRVFAGGADGPRVQLAIHRDRLARRFLIGGKLGFCEAYLDGDWSSPDVEALFRFFLVNTAALRQQMQGRMWYRFAQRLVHTLRPNSRDGAKRNIARHYDLGNEFYRTWLDPTMTYSSAVFDRPSDDDLAAAQTRKYEALARRLGLGERDELLEIGCGWGGFAEFAGKRGARVTAITISRAQWEFARERMAKAGLADRVDVQLRDYRDVDRRFDKIASIEMFEAVGERWWPTYFRSLRENLKPGGSAGLQVITINQRDFLHYRRSMDYIQKYIFPGGMLPSPKALKRGLDAAGLRLREWSSFGPDYARTLRTWNARFQAAWPRIEASGFDQRFKRMWEQYFHYCAAGFSVGTIDVAQIAVDRD
ncbi:MAG: class I SAM-dependent methyltransferase [Rhodospirillaceae bacterium]|nr:class I SAM-dependent methyltransferase [Rhodospirillaceae bacterium]